MPAIQGFETPLAVARLMHTFKHPWFIAGGWAIDLFLGRVTREHADVEIAVFREDQISLQMLLRPWKLTKVVPGKMDANGLKAAGEVKPWSVGEFVELPIHELYAERAEGEVTKLEVLLNETHGDRWAYRRNPAVTLPLKSAGLKSRLGPPILAPEIVLLYKAKHLREHDQADYDATYTSMTFAQRQWLKKAVATCHPGHAWVR